MPSADLALTPLVDPAVSIVICNYNYARYLQEAVASALHQTVPCQVIVVDDGSTDGSRRLLSEVDARVQVVLQENGGQLAAYNAGFACCVGNIVMFLDADDALEPQAAETVGRLFEASVAKVHFRMSLVDDAGHPLGTTVPSTLGRGDVLGPLVRHGLLYPSPPGSGNAYRAAVLRWLFPLPLDATDKVGADFFTIYGSVAFGKVVACESPLGRYRLHKRPAPAAADAEESLVFGNAALGNDEAAKVVSRYARLVPWIVDRTAGAVRYPARFLDFSVQKSTYAKGVMVRPYFESILGSGAALTSLLKSLWLQPAFGLKKKVGLSVWALLVLLAPRKTAFRLARHVCDPASRTP